MLDYKIRMAAPTKSTRWAFTAYENEFRHFPANPENVPQGIAEWGWNMEECPDTHRIHMQGYLRTSQQQRLAWLRNRYPGVHFEIARNWEALKEYCRKAESRLPGTEPVAAYQSIPDMYSYANTLVERLPTHSVLLEVHRAWNEVVLYHKRASEGLVPEFRKQLVRQHIKTLMTNSTLIPSVTDEPISCLNRWIYHIIIKKYIEFDIMSGMPGIEFIVQNPLFITTLQNLVSAMVLRRDGLTPRLKFSEMENPPVENGPSETDRQTDAPQNVLITFD